jgi:hypothetical protein
MENTRMERGLVTLGMAALLLGIAHTYLFFMQSFGLNYFLFALAIVFAGYVVARTSGGKIGKEQYALIALALFFSLMVFVRASEKLAFFNVLASALLFLLYVRSFTGHPLKHFLPLDYLKIPFLPLRFIIPFFETLPDVLAFRHLGRSDGRTREIVRGSIAAVLALTVFSLLFASADSVFDEFLKRIFNIELNEEFIGRIIETTVVTAFFIGAFGFALRKLHPSPAPAAPRERKLGVLESTIVLVAVDILFSIFVAIQAAYLFGGEDYLLAHGLTYSEYAVRGFEQLVLVAIFSFAMISFAEMHIMQSSGSHFSSFKILSGVMVALVILILLSAYSRLALYEEAYGFTTVRLYSYAFMVWLAAVLVFLSLHIWRGGKRETFAFKAFLAAVVLLAFMNYLNPDAYIARENIARYQRTGLIDAPYLATLSSDALPASAILLDDPNPDVRNAFAAELKWQRDRHRLSEHCHPYTCR